MQKKKRKAIFKGERIKKVNGYPGLFRFFPNKKERPLIVCVPGGRSTARLYYGVNNGFRKEDFLAHWLGENGYPLLAMSHPVELKEKDFEKSYPEFSVQDWWRLIVDITHQIIEEYGLSKSFYLVGWSAGGKSVIPTSLFSKEKGLDLKGFISLAATPPILGLTPFYWDNSEIRESGYWNTANSFPREITQIESNFKNSNSTISRKDLLSYYLGHNPISILATGWRYKNNNQFVKDVVSDIEDNLSYRYDLYPMIASIAPTTVSDMRHSLTDKYIWAAVLSQSIFCRYFKSDKYHISDLSENQMKDLLSFLDRLTIQLHRKIPNGNHCFFIGEKGAKLTADYIVDLIAAMQKSKIELKKILDV